VGQRLGDLVEGECAVDVDLDVARDTEVGHRLEVGRARPHHEQPHPATGEPGDQISDSHHPQQSGHRPSDAAVPTAWCQRPPIGEDRAMGDEVQHMVVRLEPGEVLTVVVDHLVGAEHLHVIQLAGIVDGGDVSAGPLGELDGKRPRTAAGPIDQNPTAGAHVGCPLQRDRGRLGNGRGLGEGQCVRLVGQSLFRRHCVLGEPAHQGEIVTVDLIAGLEPGDTGTDGFDPPGNVRSERPARRGAQSADPGVRRRATQTLPIGEVDRGRRHLHQYLALSRGWLGDLLDPQHIGRSVSVVDDCPHPYLPVEPVKPKSDMSAAYAGRPLLLLAEHGKRGIMAPNQEDVMAMVTDPVCGMRIDTDDAAATAEHEGKTYYFCSQVCRDTFVADPASFAD